MRHEYYSYNKDQLLSAPKIPMEVLEDKPAVFAKIAREMADAIQENNAAGKTTVFICPVGPVGLFCGARQFPAHQPEKLLVHQYGRISGG